MRTVGSREARPDTASFAEELNAAVVRPEKHHGRVSRTAVPKRLDMSPGSVYAYLNGTTLPGTEVFDGLLRELRVSAADGKRLIELRDAVDIARRGGWSRAAAESPPPPSNLPRDIAVLYGRESEIDRVRQSPRRRAGRLPARRRAGAHRRQYRRAGRRARRTGQSGCRTGRSGDRAGVLADRRRPRRDGRRCRSVDGHHRPDRSHRIALKSPANL